MIKPKVLISDSMDPNAAMIFKAKATVAYGHGGKTLKLEVNPGVVLFTLMP